MSQHRTFTQTTDVHLCPCAIITQRSHCFFPEHSIFHAQAVTCTNIEGNNDTSDHFMEKLT